MRRQFGVWVLSGLLMAACAGVAGATPAVATVAEEASADTAVPGPRTEHALGMRDEAAMVLVGSILIALASAVRRTA